MNRFLKRSAAVVLCVMLLVSSAMADAERKQPYANSKLNEAEDASKSDSLEFTVITPVPPFVDNPSMEESVGKIYGTLDSTEVGAAKNVDPVDVEKGIVKINLDVVYKPETLDVAFLLDRSGSMNMWIKNMDATGYSFTQTDKEKPYANNNVSPHNVPCMNPEHSYLINYYKMNDPQKTNYQYRYRPTDNDGNVRLWLAALVNSDVTHSLLSMKLLLKRTRKTILTLPTVQQLTVLLHS